MLLWRSASLEAPFLRPQALEARHDLSCAALAHTEEFLDRLAVEVSGFEAPQ